MKTVHMIGNAHLDPVWLWRQSDGVDAVLATARSACDRLDEYPGFIFTCSTKWFHEQVELLDPGLFDRICTFVRAGRWHPAGGMVIQPDCNLPSAEAFSRQFTTGQQYFREKFDLTATVGYNVDSFGHTAYLPRFLRDGGLDSYVFMRPGLGEKKLPANLFRWRSPDGYEVSAFRITGSYSSKSDQIPEHINLSLAELPEGIHHTMCFFGVGNHGGGPTKQQIEWIMEHADDSKDVKMIFSHPRAFFDAVAEDMEKFPVVKGELQHHAVGCYSVLRSIKTGMAKAESRLVQAEAAAELFPDHTSSEDRETLDAAWDDVLFNQFHDILGGTSLEEESMRARAELCAAESKADQVITSVSRRAFRCQARPGEHRIVALNLSDEPYEGAVEHEPWLQWRNTELSLFDEQDNPIPFQEVEADVITSGLRRLVFRLSIPARGKRILKLTEMPQAPKTGNSSPVKPELHELSGKDLKIVPGRDTICINGWKLSFEVIDDPTDTWSHAADRFDGKTEGSFSWPETMNVVESGPIRRTVRLKSTFDNSRIWARLMITGDEPILRMRLSVVWAQVRQLLRLRMEAPEAISKRTDLVSGGFLDRPTDGAEFPLNGGIIAGTGSGRTAVISPDIFSGSVTPRTINLTLLRSPHMAHHDPAPADMRPDQPVTDQGSHTFNLAVWPHCSAELNQLERTVNEMKMPPVIWDLTG